MTAEDFDTRTRERFARLDKNSDGIVDAAEVEAGMAAMGSRRREIGDMMRGRLQGRFDADRDGKITREEFLARAGREFARVDLDGDGRITDADLPPVMRGRGVLKGEASGIPGGRGARPTGGATHGGMMGGGLQRLIAADANKDGIITREEVLAEAGKRFVELDRNKDGVVDKADHDAMRKEMTDYRVRRFLHEHGAGTDGKLTREQFQKSAKERFAERDINNDGRVDRQDMMPGRGGEDMGGRRGPRMDREDAPGPGGPGMRDRGPGR